MINIVLAVLLVVFCLSAFCGLVGFFIDIIRHPQEHTKVKVIASSEAEAADPADPEEEGLTLDEKIEIDL